jgi:predicted short-subunit dehydrogenase-like oxidoreductase (DUF2520 family)
MVPMILPPGARAMYHIGSLFAGTYLLSLLNEAVEAWGTFGMNEEQTLRALLPLARGTLMTAETRGLAASLAGPISRGDAMAVARHLDALTACGNSQTSFYKDLARRQLKLAQRRTNKLQPGPLEDLRALLAET